MAARVLRRERATGQALPWEGDTYAETVAALGYDPLADRPAPTLRLVR